MAALEWSLDAPITIRSEADIQSKRVWAERFDPYAHQVQNLITFCRRAPVALLADDVGLGKTISAGLILSELMERKKVARTLVVAPKLLLPQWQEELATKFGIPAETASGAQLAGAVRRSVPVVVTTYHSLRSYLDDLRASSFDMVILDEAHKLRNLHGTAQAPLFALGVKKALEERAFKYVLMLTATPIQNRLWDLYSLIDLLTAAKGHTNPLGSPANFKMDFIEDSRAVQIRRGRREEFRQHLSNYIVRTRRSDAKLVFPTRVVKTHRVGATTVEVRLLGLIGELLREHSLNGLSQSSIGQALMSSPEALASQLEEMSKRGTVPHDLAEAVADLVVPGAVFGKLRGLVTLIQELSLRRPDDWRVVVFTSRTKTQQAIGNHLKGLRIPVGFISGSKAAENERAIRQFKANPPGVRVLVSTDAGAEGINLQVANVLVNFDLPWNPMVLEQRIGRIQRLASQHAEVTVLNLVLAGSVEEKVVARLGQKLQAISESLGDIEGILESAAQAGDDDDSFEAMIRKLVVDSLKGIDVEEATKRAMQSIEDAKRIFEEERKTVETTLGDLRDLHRTGPRVPEIAPITPSIGARDFVLRALGRDGARIRPIDGDVLAATLPGQSEFRLTFKERATVGDEREGVFGGNLPRLYIPGKRDFERLAQSWAEKAGALIVDRSNPTDAALEGYLRSWLEAIEGFSLADFKVIDRKPGFVGHLTCRASVAVAHDRLEKLVSVPIQSGQLVEIEPVSDEEQVSAAGCDSGQLSPGLHERVAAAIAAEPDLTKFSEFYRKRMEEELVAAEDAARQRRLREQFTPVGAAKAVAARGVQYTVLEVSAKVRIDTAGPYPVEFTLVPGAKGAEIRPKSEWTTCQVSGRNVPAGATDLCTLSGMRAVRHLLSRSAASGRLALTDQMVRCEQTGELLLPDETEVCSTTGRRVRKGLLSVSAVSGRAALPEEFVECELTGASVLPDELLASDVSGKRFRRDQLCTSVLTGRVGHVSEYVRSVLPDGFLARDEAAQSAVSGAWADAQQLVRSERHPGRLGLPGEVVRSEVSGRLLLRDEVEASGVSGSPALPEELVLCELTGVRCLPKELATSDVSARKYRSDQQACSVQSQRTGHVSEFVSSVDPSGVLAVDEAEQSQASGQWVLRGRLAPSDVPPHRRAMPTELVRSAVSGKCAMPDEVVRSVVSGKPALSDEVSECEFTREPVLPDELGVSEVSGKRLRVDELLRSSLSGRSGHKSEFVPSEEPTGMVAIDEAAPSAVSGRTGARVRMVQSDAPGQRLGMPDEVSVSAATGKRYLCDEVVASGLSGLRAHPDELEKCEFTGVRALPTELFKSDVSGKRCRQDEGMTSVLGGRRGHTSEFVRSVAPTGWIALDEAGQSALSGEWGARESLKPSARPPHRMGLPHELVECEVSRRTVLRDEAAVSAVSGRLVDDALLVPSAASGSRALAEEMLTCQVTGRRLLPRETAQCAISGKTVDERELEKSDVSGAQGLRPLMLRCPETQKLMLPSESARCSVTGHQVLATQTAQCVLTDRRALRRVMMQCPTSGRHYIDDAETKERMRQLTGSTELLATSQWTGNVLLSHLTAKCALTGLVVERERLNAAGELGVLRQALDGLPCEGGQPLTAESLDWFRKARPELKSAHESMAVRGPGGRVVVAAIRAKAGLLGFSTVWYAVVTSVGNPSTMLCEPIPGKRGTTGWVRQQR